MHAAGRAPLSATLVVRAAVELIEADGVASMTMRKLGQVLGVEAMALYRYLPGREQVLDAVVDVLIREVLDDPDVLAVPEDGWQDFVEHMAHGVRRVALRYPRCFPLVASRPPQAPWLRPPLRSVEWVELFLRGLVEEGFRDEDAVDAYRGFSSFLLGHLLHEVSALGASIGPEDPEEPAPDVPETSSGAFSATLHPTVARLREALSRDQAAVEFEDSLEDLLARISRTRGGPATGRRRPRPAPA